MATEEQIPQIKAKILVAHGDLDPFVPPERITAFKAALEKAGADWQMTIYGGARHSFTNPDAHRYGIEGVEYNAAADRRSWAQMRSFFDEIFAQPTVSSEENQLMPNKKAR